MTLLEILRDGPVIPVITLDRAEDAVPLARALLAGGVRILEITLRTPAAAAAIRAVCDEVPEAVTGAGTIVRAADLALARRAGAKFGVSPGATAELLAAVRDDGLPFLPGVMTPSEALAAHAAGFAVQKFFPATQAGGTAALKAMGDMFPELRFCPTGGITPQAAPDYLALANVVCVGGSWLAPRALLQARDWDGITRLARRAAALRRPAAG